MIVIIDRLKIRQAALKYLANCKYIGRAEIEHTSPIAIIFT